MSPPQLLQQTLRFLSTCQFTNICGVLRGMGKLSQVLSANKNGLHFQIGTEIILVTLVSQEHPHCGFQSTISIFCSHTCAHKIFQRLQQVKDPLLVILSTASTGPYLHRGLEIFQEAPQLNYHLVTWLCPLGLRQLRTSRTNLDNSFLKFLQWQIR